MSEDFSYNNDEDDIQNSEPQNMASKSTFVVPNSKNKLKACMKCHLLKSEDQWKNRRCENCGDVSNNMPTDKYLHVVSVIDVPSSWLKRKIRLPYGQRLVPGAYAVFVP